MADGSFHTGFDEIILFFSVENGVHSDYAYIQTFLMQQDGRLLYKSGAGLKMVIEFSRVCELIGLIK